MIVASSLLKSVIIIEIALVFIIILLTFLLKGIFYLKIRRDKRIKQEIEDFMSGLFLSDSHFSSSVFLRRWKRLDLLMLSLSELDQTLDGPSWAFIKNELAAQVMLPLARKKSNSRRRVTRLLVAKCFALFMEKQDESVVCALLEDKTPMIHLHAAIASVKFGSPTTINAVINSMSHQRRLGQTIYLTVFETADPQIYKIIVQRMKTEHDPYLLTACYKILMLFPPGEVSVNNADLNSETIDLQLAAIRFEAYTNGKQSIQRVTQMLTNPHWEVRAACCKLLGDLYATQALTELGDCLRDPIWWVRVNAANALKCLGDQGVHILKSQQTSDDLFAHETAMYVLNTPSTFK